MRPLPLRVLALATLLATGPALASPPPALRAPLPAGARLPARAAGVGPATGAAVDACGTSLEAVPRAVVAHVERAATAALPTPNSVDVGGIAVLEDDGSFVYLDSGGEPELDLAAVTEAFYRSHGDDYDFLAIYLASGMSEWLGSAGALAAAWPVRNDTQGLGLATFDYGAEFGSAARLQNLTTMNALSRYPDDPDAPIGGPTDTFNTFDVLAHEIAHRWLAYTWVDSAGTPTPALLGRDYQHWNFFFDSDSSVMEGCDWVNVGADSFVTDGATSTYGALDQYLMGMRTRAEIDSFFVVNDPTQLDPPGIYVPYSVPAAGVGCHGRATWWKLADIEAVNGPRVPDGAVAPRSFRLGFVLVVPGGAAAADSDLAKLQVIRTRFPQAFAAMTWMRGSVDVSLTSHAGAVQICARRLPDVESAAAPVAVGARVTIGPGGIPLAVDPHSVTLHWRAGTSGPFTDVPLAAAGADSFAVVAPPPATAAGVVQYWLSAASDSAGIAASLPAAGAAAPLQFTVGPDTVPPVIVHTPVPTQCGARMPQVLLARVTDNLGVDSVWCETRLDGGPLVTLPVTPAGCDTYTVAVGTGLGVGQRLAYRFVARDASVAHNLAWSSPAFDTLVVGHDTWEDFENPSYWSHSNLLWNRRDQWHLDHGDSYPPGGTAWHCGSSDGTPYEPYQDAALMSSYYYDVGPGATLVFAERHRLEQETDALAYDGARIELQQGDGPWQSVEPVPGYTHTLDGTGLGIGDGEACWSGDSHGWVTRTLDLSPWASGPVRVRFRMCADDFVGDDGMWIDHVGLVHARDSTMAVGARAPAFAAGPAWPNPTRGPLRLALTLPHPARVEWSLLDVQGRRVAVLWSGARAAGPGTLTARSPHALAPGLYFATLVVDGREADRRRVALLR